MKRLVFTVICIILLISIFSSCSLIDKSLPDASITVPTVFFTDINNVELNGETIDLQYIITNKLDLKETKEVLKEHIIQFEEVLHSDKEIRLMPEYPWSYGYFIFDKTGKSKKIILHNPQFKTSKGIHCGDKISKVIQTYGENYDKIEDSYQWALSYGNIQFNTELHTEDIDTPLEDSIVSCIVYYVE